MAKIPFNIKYRPEIEAWKYRLKVGERDARIVCWDYNGEDLIVCVNYEGTEQGLIYARDGKHKSKFPDNCPDLEIVTDEPEELTEFEQAVKDITDAWGSPDDFHPDLTFVKEQSKKLLELAKTQLEKSQWIEDMQEWWYNKGHREGFAKGQEDARKRFRERETPTFYYNGPFMPPCFLGGPCTNPHHDCINCPQQGAYQGTCKTDTNIK